MFCIINCLVYSLPDSAAAVDESGDKAVIATLHSCHDDIVKKLNFGLIYPKLNQDDILPTDSRQWFMRLLQPESRGTDINNLMVWLPKVGREKFCQFIEILKETSNEAGDAHEELVAILQERFEEYKKHGHSGGLYFSKCKVAIVFLLFLSAITAYSVL